MLSNSREVRVVPIDAVRPYPGHARRHTSKKLAKIAGSLRHFGQVSPIIIDPSGVILDGHAVWRAMCQNGAGEIAVIVVSGLDDPALKALRLALNRLPAEASWKKEKLRDEFNELIALNFDLALTGFDELEIDHVLEIDTATPGGADTPISPARDVAISTRGDMWACGRHLVACGEPDDEGVVAQIVDGTHPAVAIISLGSQKGESGPMVPAAGIGAVLQRFCLAVDPKACVFVRVNWPELEGLWAAGHSCGLRLVDLCVTTKNANRDGALYDDAYFVFGVFAHADAAALHSAGRPNLWLPPAAPTRARKKAASSAESDVAVIADILNDVTRPQEVLLAGYIGTGATLMAAETTGRTCVGIEPDPCLLDVAIRRWQRTTCRQAVHAYTGELFDDRVGPADGVEEAIRVGEGGRP